jgi:hypothetical protein
MEPQRAKRRKNETGGGVENATIGAAIDLLLTLSRVRPEAYSSSSSPSLKESMKVPGESLLIDEDTGTSPDSSSF